MPEAIRAELAYAWAVGWQAFIERASSHARPPAASSAAGGGRVRSHRHPQLDLVAGIEGHARAVFAALVHIVHLVRRQAPEFALHRHVAAAAIILRLARFEHVLYRAGDPRKHPVVAIGALACQPGLMPRLVDRLGP